MYDIKMCFPWLKIDPAFLFVRKNVKGAWGQTAWVLVEIDSLGILCLLEIN